MLSTARYSTERAVQQVSATLRPDDRCSVVTFDSKIFEEAPLSPPPLTFVLTKRTTGGTSFVDALLLSLVTAPAMGRRQLNLILTDGIDTSSYFSSARVTETMKYANGQTSIILVQGRGESLAANPSRGLIDTVTATSGGQVVVLNRDDELKSAFLMALEEFRTSYLLTFTPMGVSGGGWHPVAVTVPARANYIVRARQGYWFTAKTP